MVPDAEGYVMVLQPEEPKISLSGIDHFARSSAEFESQEGVTLFPELRIVSTITREVESDTESEVAEGADDDPTGKIYAFIFNLRFYWQMFCDPPSFTIYNKWVHRHSCTIKSCVNISSW